MQFGMKRFAHLPGVAGEFDAGATGANFYSVKTFGGEPGGSGLNVGISRAKFCAEFFGRQPGVVFWRIESQLVFQ